MNTLTTLALTLPAANTPAPPAPVPTPTPGTVPGSVPGTGPGTAALNGTVTLGVGVIMVLLLIWVVQRKAGTTGVAVLAFTTGVMLAASKVGQAFAGIGSGVVVSGMTAFASVFT